MGTKYIAKNGRKRLAALEGVTAGRPVERKPAIAVATENHARLVALGEIHGVQEAVPGWILDGATPESPRVQQDIYRVQAANEAKRPWESLGEQLMAIQRHAQPGRPTDPRLYAAATGGNAAHGADGGFAIQTDFALDLMTGALQGAVLAGRCSEYPIGPTYDSLEVAVFDETSRATGSRFGGVQVYRAAEAETVTAKKPKLGKWEARLEDIDGLAYVTERLAQDAPDALGKVFEEAFTDEFSWIIDDEIYQGSGVARCLGVLNSDAMIQVDPEEGQEDGTVVAENVTKIWKRVPAGSKRRGIWVFAPEAEDQLASLMVGTSAAPTVQYARPGETDLDHYLTIHGRPAYPLEQAPAVGEIGDIAFLDLSRYGLIRKGTVERLESIHVRFLYGERVWKWKVRINGAPKLNKPLIPARGDASNTVSPFVTLAARS